MAAVFKIDGLDLSVHLKVNQGDGLDPYDADGFLDPQWSEGGAGDGDALVSIREGNRQQSFPVILNPAKAGYASTKDGLALLVRDLNRALKAARVIEWRDDGATTSTYFDARFARFDPAWDYRRAGKLWLPGVVHVWTRPYGTTGTSRIAATAAGSGFVGMSLGTIEGDRDAMLHTTLGGIVASALAPAIAGQWVAGVCVGAASHPILSPAASLVVSAPAMPAQPSLIAASGAIASQAQRFYPNSSGILVTGLVTVTVPSAAPGRYRLLGLVRAQAPAVPSAVSTVVMWARDAYTVATQIPLGATTTFTLGDANTLPVATDSWWHIVDLGVAARGSSTFEQNQPLSALIELKATNTNAGGSKIAPSLAVDLGGVLVLPEDRSVVVVEPDHAKPVATYTFDAPNRVLGRVAGSTSAITYSDLTGRWVRGAEPQAPVGTGQRLSAFVLPDGGVHNLPVSVEVRVRERFSFSR